MNAKSSPSSPDPKEHRMGNKKTPLAPRKEIERRRRTTKGKENPPVRMSNPVSHDDQAQSTTIMELLGGGQAFRRLFDAFPEKGLANAMELFFEMLYAPVVQQALGNAGQMLEMDGVAIQDAARWEQGWQRAAFVLAYCQTHLQRATGWGPPNDSSHATVDIYDASTLKQTLFLEDNYVVDSLPPGSSHTIEQVQRVVDFVFARVKEYVLYSNVLE